MKFLLLAGVVWNLFAATADAQTRSRKVFLRNNRPLKSATLDLATGTLTRGAIVRNRSAATVTDFYNMDLGGFVGVDTGNCFCEWFDAGVKGFAGNTSDMMSSIEFAYCSAKLSPSSGGPGGSVRLGFYEGYTVFGGAPTTAVAVLTLTGLPGNTSSSSFFGGFQCYTVRVVFDELVCFRDGPFGYSWRFVDAGTDGVLAGTWPFLSCVVSCSGAAFQVDGQGMMDVIDEYCPPGNLGGCFSFCTSSGQFNSISMSINEVVPQTATVAGFNSSSFPNPDTLVASAPVVGAMWTATVTRAIASNPAPFQVYFAPTKLAPPTGLSAGPTSTWGTSKSGRMLLIAVGNPAVLVCSGVHDGTIGACGSAIPKDISLVGNGWNCQAVLLGTGFAQGPARLSSAVGGVVGTTL